VAGDVQAAVEIGSHSKTVARGVTSSPLSAMSNRQTPVRAEGNLIFN